MVKEAVCLKEEIGWNLYIKIPVTHRRHQSNQTIKAVKNTDACHGYLHADAGARSGKSRS